MMIKIKIITFVMLTQFTLFLNAANVDLQIEVNIAKTDNISFGDVVSFEFTVTNNGPDDALGDVNDIYERFPNLVYIDDVFLDYDTNNGDIILEFDERTMGNCINSPWLLEPPVIPGTPIRFGYSVGVVEITKNSSVTCYGTLQMLFKNSKRNLSFRTRVFSPDVDINLNNNVQNFVLRLKPKTIPASNRISLLILFISVLLVILFRTRKLKMQ